MTMFVYRVGMATSQDTDERRAYLRGVRP